MRPVVLTIAGSDSSAGAGIQADLKAIEANGAYAATVVTAVTAQSTTGILRIDALSAASVRAQIEAVFDDLAIAAVKTGMLLRAETIAETCRALRRYRPRVVVCDPVMGSSEGSPLLEREAVETLVRELFPLSTLVTPNTDEAALLSGIEIATADDAEEGARRILRRSGAGAVLVTGGHLADGSVTDVLVDARGVRRFEGLRLDSSTTHGTGCTLASAIATRLALGDSLQRSIERAKRFVAGAIRAGLDLGRGPGPVDPLFELHRRTVGIADEGRRGREA